MRRAFGLSLPELMVSIGIVSVVGAGMYVGFQQIDSAQQNAREAAGNANQTGLLLDLIEIETSRAGQGVNSERGRCLVSPSGSSWADSCEGDYVDTNNTSHGLATCRRDGNDFVTSLIFVSGPMAYDSSIHKDLRCEQEKGPFFNIYSVQGPKLDSCTVPALSSISQSNLRTENLCEAEFGLGGLEGNDIVVSLSTSGRLVSEVSTDNVFSFTNNATQSVDVQLATTDSLLEQSNKYLVSFERSNFAVASGSSTTSQIRLDRPALKSLDISYSINGATTCTATIEPGERFVEIPAAGAVGACANALEAGDTLELLPTELTATGENPEFEIAVADDNIPTINLSFIETSVGYGQEALQFQVVADRNLTLPPEAASSSSRNDSSILLGVGPSAPTGVTTAANVAIQATSAAFRYTGTITPNAENLGDQSFVLTINHPSAPSVSQTIWITSGISVPTLSWLKNNLKTTRPIDGESRTVLATILAEPAPIKETRVQLTAASGICGTASNTDSTHYYVENLTAESITCNEITLKAGASRTTFNLIINPKPDIANDGRSIKMAIAASGNNYVASDTSSQMNIAVQDYQVPRFDLENTTVLFAGNSATGSPDDQSHSDFISASTPTIGFASAANNELFLLEDAGSGSIVSGSIPIKLDSNIPSTSSVTIRAIPPSDASMGRFSLTNPISSDTEASISLNSTSASSISVPFWVQNDGVQQGPEQFELRIERASGDAKARKPDTGTVPSRLFVTVTDLDECNAGGDLTIGTGTSASSGFDFFGPSSSVNGQNISSARVSISSGYVSSTDELVIDGVTANTGTTGQRKYLNFTVNYNGTNYNNIDAIFYINQGVMEITRYTTANGSTKANMPANAMVKLFNEKVDFVHDPSGSTLVSSSERQVTYTLGQAQAWFSHEDGGERYYRYIGTNMDWDDAKTAAASDAKKYFGVRGYLATLTSHAENKFLATRFNDNGGPPSGWLGASDSGSEGHWKWVTGPENGRRFWKNNGSSGQYITGSGNGAGTPHAVTKSCVNQTQAWNNSGHASNDIYRLTYGYTETLNSEGVPSNNRRFANWSCYNSSTGYEPNDAGGEDRLQMTGSAKGGGMWNDLPNSRPSGNGVYDVKGYYIEYGGPSSYANNFSDRRLGATFRINPRECELVRVD